MIHRTINGVSLDVISPSFYTVTGKPQLEISYVGDCWLLFCDDATLENPIYKEFPRLEDAVAVVSQAWRSCGLI
jgi:hypothetical protein